MEFNEGLCNKILGFVESFYGAISCLNSGSNDLYPKQSIILLLTFLDQLGWLNSPNDFSDNCDFKTWCNSYIDFSDLNCSADDLWVARCGLLHMGTTRNKGFDDSKHYQIAYYSKLMISNEDRYIEESKYKYPTKLVCLDSLFEEIENGVSKFIEDILSDSGLNSQVNEKLDKMPIFFKQ